MLAYVRTNGLAITGIKTAYVGHPDQDPLPESDLPMLIVGAPQPQWRPMTLTAGGEGLLEATYPVNMLVIMGRADMPQRDAQAQQAAYADRFRAKFSPDPTLGGLVAYSDLTEGVDNLDAGEGANYRVLKQLPQMAFRLMVTEYKKRNE